MNTVKALLNRADKLERRRPSNPFVVEEIDPPGGESHGLHWRGLFKNGDLIFAMPEKLSADEWQTVFNPNRNST